MTDLARSCATTLALLAALLGCEPEKLNPMFDEGQVAFDVEIERDDITYLRYEISAFDMAPVRGEIDLVATGEPPVIWDRLPAGIGRNRPAARGRRTRRRRGRLPRRRRLRSRTGHDGAGQRRPAMQRISDRRRPREGDGRAGRLRGARAGTGRRGGDTLCDHVESTSRVAESDPGARAATVGNHRARTTSTRDR